MVLHFSFFVWLYLSFYQKNEILYFHTSDDGYINYIRYYLKIYFLAGFTLACQLAAPDKGLCALVITVQVLWSFNFRTQRPATVVSFKFSAHAKGTLDRGCPRLPLLKTNLSGETFVVQAACQNCYCKVRGHIYFEGSVQRIHLK